MKYILEMSESQAKIIKDALDLYSRIHMGQVTEVVNVLQKFYTKISSEELEFSRNLIDAIKKRIWGFESGASYGINSPEITDDARIAFDIQQVIRHEMWKNDAARRNYVVSASPAIKTSKIPLPNIESSPSSIYRQSFSSNVPNESSS